MKNKVYYYMPAKWRKRVKPLSDIIDEMQLNLEASIGWKKDYSKRFAILLDPNFTNEELDLILAMAKYAFGNSGDEVSRVQLRSDRDTFSQRLQGIAIGKTPKLKRVRMENKCA